MRILITAPELTKRGGVANYLAALSKHLVGQVDVFTVGARERIEGKVRTLIRVLEDSRGFYRKTRSQRWDIVHLNPSLGWKAVLRDGLLLAIAERRGLKTVVFFHGWDKGLEARLRGFGLRVFAGIYFRADAIVVLAREFENTLRAWGYTGPIYVETVVFGDDILVSSAIDERLSKPRGSANLLFLSRIERSKGVYTAIDAFGLLKAKYPDLKLTVAGDGYDLTACRKYVHDAGLVDVQFPGYLTGRQKVEAFHHADIYVFPSSFGEGMPLSVVEAMASGLPVVTRPVGGLRDFFDHGRMGFMTESTDHRVFAELIEKLILDPELRATIAHHNEKYAKEHFMASRVAERIEAVYRDVLRPME